MVPRLPQAVLPAALALAVCAGPCSAPAAEPLTPAYVAVLDLQEVLRQCDAAKALRARIEKEQAEYQTELAKQENALRNASDELMVQRDQLQPEEFQSRRQKIDQQLAELRRQAQARKRQLETTYNDGMDKVRQAVLEVVTAIAEERGANLVLDKASVVIGAGKFDVTAEVLARLNAALPSVEVPPAK
ncbi:MAG: OmpH family outer membrane protein [Rhodospirillaceae bacterium]|nr:OmpH family outer membrane protein [Rhodospirillaceae bacterium]